MAYGYDNAYPEWIKKMKIGLMSDLHLYRKPRTVLKALECLRDVDLLLIAGDLVDRGTREQYDLLAQCIQDTISTIPVLCVSGNHDNPRQDDTNYRSFERYLNTRCTDMAIIHDESGAFKVDIDDYTDLYGLNPLYNQKLFSFPEHGQQLTYLESTLSESMAKRHIIMCHAPLIEHNPQRNGNMPPYFSKEQDGRLQDIIDKFGHVIFLSGHTHITPSVEFDEAFNNLYINDGSICPTTVKGGNGDTRQGNVTELELLSDRLNIKIYGIYTKIGFFSDNVEL